MCPFVRLIRCDLRCLLWLPLAWLAGTGIGVAQDDVDFGREVRPILSKYCLRCHGPDEGARKAGLRLDLRDAAVKVLESGAAAIVPGKPDQSELLRRITSTDADEVMPPKAAKTLISPEQQATLRRWIAAGAEYKQHWSFIAPRQAPLPEVKLKSWPVTPIDAFILSRLERAGLSPSPRADRATLIRRVSLDLIGLPPTVEEVEGFVRDDSPQAWERLVDRLLASPRYGERWARRWLDLARYADTNGYEKDRPRSIWPYRDWVITALNSDLPFDQFTVEQLAGDLLPNATTEQRIATGFHRNTMLNEEGGIDPLEFRFNALTDRVATTATVWLGLTLQCAQCHNHKYDPLTQRDFYQTMAFLNNADEPDLDLPKADAAELHRKNLARAEQLLKVLPSKWPLPTDGAPHDKQSDPQRRELAEKAFQEWLTTERAKSVDWRVLHPTQAISNSPLLTVQPDDSVLASGDITKSDKYELTLENSSSLITAVRLEALPDLSLPGHGPGLCYYEGPKGDFFLGEFQLSADGRPIKFADASHSYAKNGFGASAAAKLALDGDPQTGWTCSGRYGEAHEAVFIPAEPISGQQLRVTMLFGRHFASSLGRFRISVTTDDRPAVARDLPAAIQRLLSLPPEKLTSEQRQELFAQFLLSVKELEKDATEIKKLRQPLAPTTTLVLRERPPENPRPTFVHKRGEYLQPDARVEPGTPGSLPAFSAGAPRNRWGFALWIVSPENPLAARVAVNRQWQAFFGRGLVRTLEDFGLQGEAPTHPELLDWLAVEFVKQGWSQKKLHKLIVMSATYQQLGHVRPELLAKDPENRLIGHFPHSRLDAEIIRDAALQASGLLSLKMGGPGVHPPQPEGVTEVAYGHPAWTTSTGEDRYRRSVYTFIKRTAPFAMFNTFDAPSGESCLARRDQSNTPLQSLTLLNDVMFVDATQAAGKLLVARPGEIGERVRYAFQRCFARLPTESEAAKLVQFVETQRARCLSKELDAAAIAGTKGSDAAERAAWTLLARALFNLDEFVTKP